MSVEVTDFLSDLQEHIDSITKTKRDNEDADVLFDIFSSLCLTAREYHCISESEMCAFLDYKKEQMRRRVFGIEDKTKKGKQKDFGPDKKDLR